MSRHSASCIPAQRSHPALVHARSSPACLPSSCSFRGAARVHQAVGAVAGPEATHAPLAWAGGGASGRLEPRPLPSSQPQRIGQQADRGAASWLAVPLPAVPASWLVAVRASATLAVCAEELDQDGGDDLGWSVVVVSVEHRELRTWRGCGLFGDRALEPAWAVLAAENEDGRGDLPQLA